MWTGDVLVVLNDRWTWVVELVVTVAGSAVCVVPVITELGWVVAVGLVVEAEDTICGLVVVL